MISKEFILRQVIGMGADRFDLFVSFILKEIFDLNSYNVNGKGDGGSDFRSLDFSGRPVKYGHLGQVDNIAIQVTVQDRNWVSKALKDAHKVRENLPNMKYFYFITSRPREQVDLLRLQARIQEETELHATCLGARELSEMIFNGKLFSKFCAIAGLEVTERVVGKPNPRLRLLHTFVAMHGLRASIRDEMYDSVLLGKLLEKEGVTRKDLIDSALYIFNNENIDATELDHRIDALLDKDIQSINGKLFLVESTKDEILTANSIYDNELREFENILSEIIGCQQDLGAIPEFAMDVASVFVQTQLQSLNRFAQTRLFKGYESKESPLARLNRKLISLKIKPDLIRGLTEKILSMASQNALIKKLVNGVAFAILEYGNNSSSVLMLGTYDWQKVDVILDANIIIPYLIHRFFTPNSNKGNVAINRALTVLKRRGARIVVTSNYLNECSAHLVEAWDGYREIIEDHYEELQYSDNAFVSHYCQAKVFNEEEFPASFEEYVRALSPDVIFDGQEKGRRIERTESALHLLFDEYEIESEEVHRVTDDDFRRSLDYIYDIKSFDQKIQRKSNLREHDINLLLHLKKESRIGSRSFIFLTWDKMMLQFSNKMANEKVTILTPAEANDVFQTTSELTEDRLYSISYLYASTVVSPKRLAANFLDKLVELSSVDKADWKWHEQCNKLLGEFMSRKGRALITAGAEDVQGEIQKFIEKEAIKSL